MSNTVLPLSYSYNKKNRKIRGLDGEKIFGRNHTSLGSLPSDMSFGNNVTQGRKKTDEMKSIITKQTLRERLLYKKFGVMPYQPFYPAPYPRHYYSPPYLYRRLPPHQVPSNTALSHTYGAFPFDFSPQEPPFPMPSQIQSPPQPQFQPYFYMGQPPYSYGTSMPVRPFLPPPFYLPAPPDVPYGTAESMQYPYVGPGYIYRSSQPTNTPTPQSNTMITLKPLKSASSDSYSVSDKKENEDTDSETDSTAILSLLANPPACWHRPPISPVDHTGEPIGTLTIITKKITNVNEFEEAFPSILSSFDIGAADWEEFISGLNQIISSGNQRLSAHEYNKKMDPKEEEHISLWNNYFFLSRGICIQSTIDGREYLTVYAI